MSNITVEKTSTTAGTTPAVASTPVVVGARVSDNAPGPGFMKSGEVLLKVPKVDVANPLNGLPVMHPKYYNEIPSRRNEHYHLDQVTLEGHVIVNVLESEAKKIVEKYKDAKIIDEVKKL